MSILKIVKKLRVVAVILTGGQGKRVSQKAVPKQFLTIASKPMFIHSLETYDTIDEVDEICLVINKRFKAEYQRIMQGYCFTKNVLLADGGEYRHDSIKNAVLKIGTADIVVIQNGASPVTPRVLIKECIACAKLHKAVTAYMPAYHTVFSRNRGVVGQVMKRENIGYTCDPQVFEFAILKKAIDRIPSGVRKDVPMVQAVQGSGQTVHLIQSDLSNHKITVEHDVKTVEYILNSK